MLSSLPVYQTYASRLVESCITISVYLENAVIHRNINFNFCEIHYKLHTLGSCGGFHWNKESIGFIII